MKNFLALVGLFVVGFAAIGWYCGWYKLSFSRNTDGKLQIKTDVDTNKVAEDSSAFFERMRQNVSENAAKNGQPAKTPTLAPPPPAKGATFDGGWLLAPSKPATGGR